MFQFESFKIWIIHFKVEDVLDEGLPNQEEREEAERNKKEGGLFSLLKKMFVGSTGGEKGIKGGIFGISKLFGSGIWKTLKILFTAIKWIGIGALALGAIAFFALPPAKQEEMIKSVTDFFVNVGKWLKHLGDAFSIGFMEEWVDDEKGNAGISRSAIK